MTLTAYEVRPHPLSIVIFSKDRAAQLDLCLKSINKNLSALSEHWKIYVIYASSSKEFEDGLKKESFESQMRTIKEKLSPNGGKKPFKID